MRSFGFLRNAAFCLAISCAAGSAQAAFFADLFNTGVDGAGAPLAGGVDDPHYSVVRVVPLAGIRDIVAPEGFPLPAAGPWVANDANSKWIGVATNDSGTLDMNPDPSANGIYNWTTSFFVPFNADLSTISISGLWGSDNPGLDILLNGVGTGNTSSGFTSLDAFSIASSLGDVFIPGVVNTLTFIVQNTAQVDGNPTGLRVDDMVSSFDVLPPIGAVPEASSFLVVGLGGIVAFGALGLGKRYGISLKV